MDGLLNILDHIAPISGPKAIPLSKIVVVLLRVVHGMVKAHGQVDTDIEELFKTLRETLLQAAQCEGNDVKQQAVKLVGSSVAIVDGWVHERSGSTSHTLLPRVKQVAHH
ncbi:hypothetical protein BC835DRAFT_406219 [Cytidiella melzeri]|nr:hypothetical protein BC835DRAFT_406219 [Cytidiella melzeri]